MPSEGRVPDKLGVRFQVHLKYPLDLQGITQSENESVLHKRVQYNVLVHRHKSVSTEYKKIQAIPLSITN